MYLIVTQYSQEGVGIDIFIWGGGGGAEMGDGVIFSADYQTKWYLKISLALVGTIMSPNIAH